MIRALHLWYIFILSIGQTDWGIPKTQIPKKVGTKYLFMKLIISCWFVMIITLTLHTNICAQTQITPCISVSTEAIAPDPQSGLHNYFGIKLTVSHIWDQDIIVTGNIYDAGDPDTNHSYILTILAGNLTAETSVNFYETSPTTEVDITISAIGPLFVTKDGITYSTYGNCSQFNEELLDLSVAQADSIISAGAVSDSILNGFNEQQQNEFFTYLAVNDARPTASYYSMNTDVELIRTKYLNAWAAIWDMVQNVYCLLTQ